MAYSHSQVDKALTDWFEHDHSSASLRSIAIRKGALRGLSGVELPIDFPITAIAGRNGSGKSTILGLAACAFHSTDLRFNPIERPKPYYTMADFFVQAPEVDDVADVEIEYVIDSDQWATPTPPGKATQLRRKKQGGRWSNYDRRVERSV